MRCALAVDLRPYVWRGKLPWGSQQLPPILLSSELQRHHERLHKAHPLRLRNVMNILPTGCNPRAGGARETTADGFETFIATNCLGPHLLTLLLLPHLQRSAEVCPHGFRKALCPKCYVVHLACNSARLLHRLKSILACQ